MLSDKEAFTSILRERNRQLGLSLQMMIRLKRFLVVVMLLPN